MKEINKEGRKQGGRKRGRGSGWSKGINNWTRGQGASGKEKGQWAEEKVKK